MSDPQDPSWYLEHKRRWPLDLSVLVAVLLTVWTAAAGHGAKLARAEVPAHEAALRAMQPPAVPDEQNAAVLWRQAAKAVLPWTTLEPPSPDTDQDDPLHKDPARLTKKDLRLPEVYAADRPLQRWVAANPITLDLAEQAAKRDACDWSFDWSKGLLGTTGDKQLSDSRDVSRLVAKHALVAAHQQHWSVVADDVRLLLTLADHQRHGPGLIPFLIANSTRAMAVGVIQDALAVPGARPGHADLDALASLAREQSTRMLDTRPCIPFELHSGLLIMTRMGGGDLSGLPRGGGSTWIPGGNIPSFLNPYAPVWAIDRGCLMQIYDDWQRDPESANAEAVFMRMGYSRTGVVLLTGLLAPATSMLQRSAHELTWRWRMAQVALAIAIWADAHADTWPVNLTDLGLDQSLLADPWQPKHLLRLLASDDGSLDCWSAGRNGKDETHGPAETPVRWSTPSTDDIVFHLASRKSVP